MGLRPTNTHESPPGPVIPSEARNLLLLSSPQKQIPRFARDDTVEAGKSS